MKNPLESLENRIQSKLANQQGLNASPQQNSVMPDKLTSLENRIQSKLAAQNPQNNPNRASTIGEDIEAIGQGATNLINAAWEGAKNLPAQIRQNWQNASEAFYSPEQFAERMIPGVIPAQTAAGLIPGVTSLGDVPALAWNAVTSIPNYAVEKITGQKIPEAENNKIPYIFEEFGTNIANQLAGEPQTTTEKIERGVGQALGSLVPAKAPVELAKKGGALIKGGKDAISNRLPNLPTLSPTKRAEENLRANFGNNEKAAKEAIKMKKQANELGLNLKPGEASGNPLLLTEEASQGKTKKGALNLHENYKSQIAAQEKVIDNLLNEITPDPKIVTEETRTLAQKIAEKPVAIREKAAKPLYDKAYNDTVGEIVHIEPEPIMPIKQQISTLDLDNAVTTLIKERYPGFPENIIEEMKKQTFPTPDDMTPENIKGIFGEDVYDKLNKKGYFETPVETNVETVLEKPLKPKRKVVWPKEIRTDSTIMSAIKETKKVPYKELLKKYPKNSVAVLDQAKQILDAKIQYYTKFDNKTKLAAYTRAKNKLTSIIDRYSPTYKRARGVYEKLSPAVQKMNDSKIGKIANSSDEQLTNHIRNIFDPTKTDPARFAQFQNEISKESPEMWRSLLRQAIEGNIEKGAQNGSAFYKNILQDKRFFKRLQNAASSIPSVQHKLNLLKKSFQHLENASNAKLSAAVSGQPTSLPTSWYSAAKSAFDKFLGGMYDNAAIDLTIGNKWDHALKKIYTQPPAKQPGSVLKLLDKIEQSGTTKNTFLPRLEIEAERIYDESKDKSISPALNRILDAYDKGDLDAYSKVLQDVE